MTGMTASSTVASPGSAGAFVDAISMVTSGALVERCLATLQMIQWRTGAAGIALLTVEAQSLDATVIASSEYPTEVTRFVASREFLIGSAAVRRQLRESTRLLTWEQAGFPDSAESDRVLTSAGYRNGVSLPLWDEYGRLVGVTHANTTSAHIATDVCDILLGLRPILAKLATNARSISQAGLTSREKEVLQLIRVGLTNAEIARSLVLADRTVATHAENIFRKLSVANRVEAAVWACEVSL